MELNYTKWLGNKYLNAAVAVWETGDYNGASELLWRWWNYGIITPLDIFTFANVMERDTEDQTCVRCIDRMKKHATELIEEEKRKNINEMEQIL